MELFHVRNKWLIVLAIVGGVYLPSIERIVHNKALLYFMQFYTAFLTAGVTFFALMALRHTVFLAKNLIVVIMAANNLFNDGLGCSRSIIFNINRHKLQKMFDMWDGFFTNDGNGKRRQELLNELRKPKKKYVIWSGCMMQFMLVSWASEQFVHNNNAFSVPVGVPFHNTRKEFLFFAVYIFFCFFFFGAMMLSVDLLTMEVLTLVGAEFKRLQEQLAQILGSTSIDENGRLLMVTGVRSRPFANKGELEYHFKKVEKQLNVWVQQHQKLYIFHGVMKDNIYYTLGIQLFCSTITICLISFILATNLLKPVDALVGLFFFVPTYVLFFVTSKYGDVVTTQAAQVATPAFATCWTVYPPPIKKTLHIISLRTNMPLNIKIMALFPLGSPTYFQIIQTAYSFYSFLRFVTSQMEAHKFEGV